MDQKAACTVWDNGDEEYLYCYGAQEMKKLARIGDYETKIFFDSKLPEGAIRATLKDLGLEGYMVQIGICKGDK